MSASAKAIENLIATYAELVDDGDLAGVGMLLAQATFTSAAGTVSGGGAIERLLRGHVLLYDDGTPRTKHVTTNVIVEVDEAAGSATARSYFTVIQAVPDSGLETIVAGRYRDTFVRETDGRWRFASRHVHSDLVGDVSHHLRSAGA